jgi:hypothetical protein
VIADSIGFVIRNLPAFLFVAGVSPLAPYPVRYSWCEVGAVGEGDDFSAAHGLFNPDR